ncbi:MAG TPA: hypothetical protein VFC39_15190, partial [Acidobacteriaceae bacterium]|nr:hypothetical protein [Acidobacteriaceae bacterium]
AENLEIPRKPRPAHAKATQISPCLNKAQGNAGENSELSSFCYLELLLNRGAAVIASNEWGMMRLTIFCGQGPRGYGVRRWNSMAEKGRMARRHIRA